MITVQDPARHPAGVRAGIGCACLRVFEPANPGRNVSEILRVKVLPARLTALARAIDDALVVRRLALPPKVTTCDPVAGLSLASLE